MKKYLLLAIMLFLFVSISAQIDYYFYKGEKIPLKISNKLLYVSSTDSLSFSNLRAARIDIKMKSSEFVE